MISRSIRRTLTLPITNATPCNRKIRASVNTQVCDVCVCVCVSARRFTVCDHEGSCTQGAHECPRHSYRNARTAAYAPKGVPSQYKAKSTPARGCRHRSSLMELGSRGHTARAGSPPEGKDIGRRCASQGATPELAPLIDFRPVACIHTSRIRQRHA